MILWLTDVAGPFAQRVPLLIGMSFRPAIPGELLSSSARFRFAGQNHSATKWRRWITEIQPKLSVPGRVCLKDAVHGTVQFPVFPVGAQTGNAGSD